MSGSRRLSGPARAALGLGAAALLAVVGVTTTSGTASAAGPGGAAAGPAYTVDAAIDLSGNAAPGGPGRHTVHVAVKATCRWLPLPGNNTNGAAMVAYYDSMVGTPAYVIGQLGNRADWVAAAQSSTPMAWYRAECVSNDLYAAFTQDSFTFNGAPLAVTYAIFPVANGGPPAPRIDPRDLAEAAHNVMVLLLPQVDRNPRTAATGGGTLVGLPTWFWVTDPNAVGGAAGTRNIRAEVNGGAVWAEVTATTAGLQLASPAATTTCPPAKAVVVWKAGLADAAGCTVTFPRASVAYPAGYPVTATATWQATWVGSGGTGGGLPALNRQTTTQVPVAESQSLVGVKP